MPLLASNQLRQFKEDGWLALPGVLGDALAASVRADIDEVMLTYDTTDGSVPLAPPGERSYRAVAIAERATLGALPVFAPVVQRVAELMAARSGGRPTFSFHHQHASRFEAGAAASAWHNDYEQYPQLDRDLLMCHCFYYPNGLDSTVGDLILQPRSHRVIMPRGRNQLGFDAEELPGSVTVDRLPPGSCVIVHSALLHGRRAKPGGENHPRYFTDVSYCQHRWDGVAHWPAYGIQNRPGVDTWGAVGGSLHGAVFEAHQRCGRDRTPLAIEYGIFNLDAFWDASQANEQQRAALRRQQRLSSGHRL